jgi:hypothetical protein
MSLPVTIENESLRVELYPQFGGKVTSVIDKADKFELLFDYAAELPTSSHYNRPYTTGWYAGWDECFPAVGPGPYPGHPYDGVTVPDHGEIWSLPAVAEPTRNGITTVWHGLRFGYRFSRTLTLDGPSIVCAYTLTNLAPFDFRFVWAQHALLSLSSPVHISLRERRCKVDHDASQRDLQTDFTWPITAEGDDVSRPDRLPARRGWKIFTLDRIAHPVVIDYPQRGRKLEIDYAADDTQAYWGIWINTGGWNAHNHIAIEPTTGRFDDLDRSTRDHSAGRIEPTGRREWKVKWRVG